MADLTHSNYNSRQPGMFSLPSFGCRESSVLPGTGRGDKQKKKSFYLVRMKPLKEPTNNNVSFVIHCHIGKEIKHICSNCSRGEEAREGELKGCVCYFCLHCLLYNDPHLRYSLIESESALLDKQAYKEFVYG